MPNFEIVVRRRSPKVWKPSPWALLGLILLLRAGHLAAQGMMPVVMHTGSGSPLITQTVSYTNGRGVTALNIDFGFATDEQPQPGFIPDSFTISITGPDGTGYLVTLDAHGAQWTPTVPGALPVDASSLQFQTTPFLGPTMGLTNLDSFALAYTLPTNWLGATLTINFDLFDNQNALPSLGYYSVPIPEPSGAALLVLGLALWRCARRPRL